MCFDDTGVDEDQCVIALLGQGIEYCPKGSAKTSIELAIMMKREARLGFDYARNAINI